ncbi:MAG: tetratricopeptide repeat protein [Candidatus Promineofilum sp.]|nr:tetratricopeptide repeat protein [Promineifilum sp.]
MARQKQRTPATIFTATVRSVLEHFDDPAWLGHHSPLASPYFLGESGVIGMGAPTDRGRALQDVVRQAADRMWDGPLPATRVELAAAVDESRATQGSKSSRYHFYLLELRYLRRYYPPSTFPTSAEAIPGFVNTSPTRFFIHLEEAIDELGRYIIDRLNPALRLESPGLARELIGRDPTVAAIEADLYAGRSAAITGPGGVGKTSIGAALIARWLGVVFWYTFHPGLNDDIGSLLFSLGHFMRNAGAPMLWAQLLAGTGEIASPAQALGMLRMDLETIADRQPLLVFDEVDLLQTATGDPRRKQHAQVLELLESLRGVAPLLLIGQRVYIDTDVHHALEPLTVTESDTLLNTLGIESGALLTHRIHQFTGGNPRQLELFAALVRHGDEAASLLRLPRDASARPLFNRLWRRLDEVEHEVLGALSVYRSFAPRDTWSKYDVVLGDLIQRSLVKIDLAGGIALLPFIRELVQAALPPEKRRRYNLDAAMVRSQLSDYTAAAHHFVAGELPEAAVEVWFTHQEQEIMAGQAATADEIFSAVDAGALDDPARVKLQVIRNRLAILRGEAERVLAEMDAFSWDVEDEPAAEALGQLAHAYMLRDQAGKSLSTYDDAINMLARLATKITGWHFKRSQAFMLESDSQGAEREIWLAESDLEYMRGLIDYKSSRFAPAQEHFLASQQLAEKADDQARVAGRHYGLAMIAGRKGDMPAARHHAELAMAHYAEIGDRLQLEGLRAELAGMYLNVGQFEEVIAPSEKALAFFERTRHDLWVSTISTNLAEAYMETGRLEQAKEMVFKTLRMEIPNARPYALYTLGHVYAREGNIAHALTSFRDGIEAACATDDPFIEAYLQRALGILLARNQRPDEATEPLERALCLFREMGLEHEIEATNREISEA